MMSKTEEEEFAICIECGNSIEKCVCVCPYCGERDKCECALFDSATNVFSKVCAEMGYRIFGKREFYSNIKGEHSYFVVRVSDEEIHSNVNDVTLMASFDA